MPPLSDYLRRIDNLEILIPQFQRQFVWEKKDMISLISSLLKGYPISSFLLMENSQNYSCREVEGADPLEPNIESLADRQIILDGQQRSTSAYQILYGKGDYLFYLDYNTFCSEIGPITDSSTLQTKIEDKLDDLIVCFDSDDTRNPLSYAEQLTRGLFPLKIILNQQNGVNYTQWLSAYAFNFAGGDSTKFDTQTRISQMFTERLLVNIIRFQTSKIIIPAGASPNIICAVFEAINSTGIKLTVTDLLNARCYPIGFYLNEKIEETIDTNPILKNYEKDNNPFIGSVLLKIISLKENGACQKSNLMGLNPDTIASNWDVAVNCCIKAVDYFKKHFGVIGMRYFPYKELLAPYAVIINSNQFDENNTAHVRKINCLYWRIIFDNHFSNGTEGKSANIIKDMCGDGLARVGWLGNDNDVPDFIQRTNYLMNSTFNELDKVLIRSAWYKAVLNLITLEALDFSNERNSINSFDEDDLDDHHIFPRRLLQQIGIGSSSEINSILNRTLISSSSNRRIGALAPSTYLNDDNLVGLPILPDFLDKHFIDIHYVDNQYALGQLTAENFRAFRLDRKNRIVSKVLEFITY